MKGNSQTYRPLSELIDEALLDTDKGIHLKERAARWGIKYAEEVHFDYGWDIKTVPVDLKPWKAIELPADCVDWVLFGIQCGNDIKTFINQTYLSVIYTLDEDGQKKPNENCEFFNLEDLPTYEDSLLPFHNTTTLGENPGKLFGQLVKDNGLGYYTENKNKDVNEIQFRFIVKEGQKIYLMYVTNGFHTDEETMIHPYFGEYIISGIKTEIIRHGRDKTGLKDSIDELDRQRLRVIDKQWDYGTEDVIEYLKSGYGLYPKK